VADLLIVQKLHQPPGYRGEDRDFEQSVLHY